MKLVTILASLMFAFSAFAAEGTATTPATAPKVAQAEGTPAATPPAGGEMKKEEKKEKKMKKEKKEKKAKKAKKADK